MKSFAKYKSESRDYSPFPDVSKNEGNCNTVSTGALVGAGVDVNVLKNLDPTGANPGLGDPLPEMVPQNSQSGGSTSQQNVNNAFPPNFVGP